MQMKKTDRLRGLIAEKRLTRRYIAERLGITPKTLYIKLNLGTFTCAEASKLAELLELSEAEAAEMFF